MSSSTPRRVARRSSRGDVRADRGVRTWCIAVVQGHVRGYRLRSAPCLGELRVLEAGRAEREHDAGRGELEDLEAARA